MQAARVKSVPKSGHISAHKMVMHAHAYHKTAQQSKGGMMDRDRKTKGGASSEPAFDVSQVCLRVRDLFGLTGEFVALVQIELNHGGARLEHNDVTCGAMTAVGECFCETCRLVCLMVRLLVQSRVSESFASGGNQEPRCPLPG